MILGFSNSEYDMFALLGCYGP